MEFLLFPLKALLIGLDLAVTLVTFGWLSAIKKAISPKVCRSVPVGHDNSHRVDPRYKGNLVTTPQEDLVTLYDLANNAFRCYASRKCMGTRDFLGWKNPKVKHFGGIKWKTFNEVGILAHTFGAALRKEGLVPAPEKATLAKITTSCGIAIYENTCSEWMIAALGAFSQSIIVTTIYDNLGLSAVVDAINEGSISAIVCNKANVAKLVECIEDMPTLRTIIYTNDAVAPDDKMILPTSSKRVKVVEFYEFAKAGDVFIFPTIPPKGDTCAVVMYTSGSTGKPKGVVIPHRSIVAACTAVDIALELREGDVYLGYLPLAHILEMLAQIGMVAKGCTICYADPRTLTSTGAYPVGALEQYSPTVMAAVPKIWDVIKKGIQAKVQATSPLKQFLVKTAFEARKFAISHGYDTPLFKFLVFNKFSRGVGGRLRLALTGGGPINAEVQEFIRTFLGCPFVQGYGLTETCACLTIQNKDDLRPGIAGVPLPSVEVKLESTPQVTDKAGQPYMSHDRTDHEGNRIFGRGEILVRGTNLTLGYYQMPEKTKEDFRDDGFFMTGDIGQFMSDGSLRIVDRKKNLVKLKGGEYVALERMEVVYGNSTFVDAIAGGICCYGDGDMDRPVALLQLSEAASTRWAKANGIVGNFKAIASSNEFRSAVMADMMKEHSKGGLSHLEKLYGIAFLTDPWTPENGCLTAANKLDRRAVAATFSTELDEVKNKGKFD